MSTETDPTVQYMVNYFRALSALGNARDRASAMAMNVGLPPDIQARASATSHDLDSEIIELKAAHNAFMAKFDTPQPPSDDTVKAAVAKAQALAALVADDILAEGKLKVIIGVIDTWNDVAAQPTGGAAAAASATPFPRMEASLQGTSTGWLLKRMAGRAAART